MIRILATVSFLLSLNSSALGQIDIHQFREKIALEVNDDFFIPGEEILIAVKVITPEIDFDISQVVYVELLDRNLKPVLQQKAQLIEGKTDCSLYLPSYLKTDNYLLTAYTKWSKNFVESGYNQHQITIINPFNSIPIQNLKNHASFDSVRVALSPQGGQYYNTVNQMVNYSIFNEYDESVIGFLEIKSVDDSVIYRQENSSQGSFAMNPVAQMNYSITVIDTLDRIHLSRFRTEELFIKPIQTAENEDEIIIEPNPNYEEAYKIEIHSNAKASYSFDAPSSTIRISKDSLSSGIVQLMAKSIQGRVIYEEQFYNETEQVSMNIKVSEKLKANQSYQLELISPFDGDVTVSLRKKEFISNKSNQLDQYFRNLIYTQGDTNFRAVSTSEIIDNLASPLQSKYLPDFLGETFSGQLKSSTGKSVDHINFHLTTLGTEYRIYPITSTTNGEFTVTIDPMYDYDQMYFSIDGDFSVELSDPFENQFSFTPPTRLLLDSAQLQDNLITKAVQVQLLNLYSENETPLVDIDGIFDEKKKLVYDLDDYTRFPTLLDPIREYIPLLVVKKEVDQQIFQMRNVDNQTGDYPVLSTLDGMIISPDQVLSLDQSLIQKIEIHNAQFQIGSMIYSGFVNFLSYPDAILPANQEPDHIYYKQIGMNHQNDELKFQNLNSQLIWKPNYTLKANEQNIIQFKTSNIPGTYLLKITGILEKGVINITKEIQVSN